ncbi:MAG TPA: hypothetical protein P5217_05490 [Methanoregulaceae archaeon]|nr:hypothetical protein [Methanoregulaceae archaeon]
MVLLLFVAAGTTGFLVSPVSAENPLITIAADGDGSYYLGEEAVFSGVNTGTDTIYLFITGPNLPENGGKLTSPSEKSVGGDAGSFTAVKTKPDTTWTYPWYTSGLRLDAGTYTVYAVSQPKAKDQLAGVPYGTIGIIIKKPFITAAISPTNVEKGQPFAVTGIAEGLPPLVQVWIFGDNSVYPATIPVNSDANFTFNADAALSGTLPAGQNYLIVQHPMADNRFDFTATGDYVRNLKQDNGTDLYRVTGPGSLQGSGAALALAAAISDQEAHDTTLTNDTYTIIPFRVTDAGSPSIPTATAAMSVSVQGTTPRHASLQYAVPLGAGILGFLGIVLWKRH